MNQPFDFKYKGIFDETVDGLIISDGFSEKILDVNKSACSLIGYEKDLLIGNRISDYFEKDNIPLQEFTGQLVLPECVFSERKLKTNSGQSIPVDVNFNTICDGESNYIMTTLRDIRERLEYENEIIQMDEKLDRTNAGKDKLFSIIAHDLKNPMMALMGLSEILADDTEEISLEEITEFSGMIRDLSKNTYELLENLLNWSKLQTKDIELEKSEFSLVSLINKIINVLKPSAELKKVGIINKIEKGFTIIADEGMINTVIRNLISNSIKFSSAKKNITINADEDSEKWYIHVIDEGMGMDEKYIENIFRIDTHTSRSGTNKEKGTGLGLILCSEFIKLHGGEINVLSEVDKGTEFIIQLPKPN